MWSKQNTVQANEKISRAASEMILFSMTFCLDFVSI